MRSTYVLDLVKLLQTTNRSLVKASAFIFIFLIKITRIFIFLINWDSAPSDTILYPIKSYLMRDPAMINEADTVVEIEFLAFRTM